MPLNQDVHGNINRRSYTKLARMSFVTGYIVIAADVAMTPMCVKKILKWFFVSFYEIVSSIRIQELEFSTLGSFEYNLIQI